MEAGEEFQGTGSCHHCARDPSLPGIWIEIADQFDTGQSGFASPRPRIRKKEEHEYEGTGRKSTELPSLVGPLPK